MYQKRRHKVGRAPCQSSFLEINGEANSLLSSWRKEGKNHPGDPTHLLLLIEPLLVTVWDVDTSGTQHIEELQMIQCVFHFSAAGTLRTQLLF